MATSDGYYSNSDDNLGQDQSDYDPASSTPADTQNTVVRVCLEIQYTIPSFSLTKEKHVFSSVLGPLEVRFSFQL